MHEKPEVRAAIIIIGDEILSGRTADRNGNYITRYLTDIGITVCEIRVVPDIEAEIVHAVNRLRARYDYVITTGGIGPTHDDITADSIAKAFDCSIEVDERALDLMRQRYSEEKLTGERLRMARIPQGASLIENPISAAPGFMVENVVVLAGIPDIMQAMLNCVTPMLRTGPVILSATVRIIVAESQIASLLRQTQDHHDSVSIGSYPFVTEGRYGVQLVVRSTNKDHLRDAVDALLEPIKERGLDPLVIDAPWCKNEIIEH